MTGFSAEANKANALSRTLIGVCSLLPPTLLQSFSPVFPISYRLALRFRSLNDIDPVPRPLTLPLPLSIIYGYFNRYI